MVLFCGSKHKEVYACVAEVVDKTGIIHSSIANCCNNKQATANGLHWQYFTTNVKSINQIDLELNRRKKPVICIETGVIYESASDTGKQTKSSGDLIGYCCNGKKESYKGLHWEFISGEKFVTTLLPKVREFNKKSGGLVTAELMGEYAQ